MFQALNSKNDCLTDAQSINIATGVTADIFENISYLVGVKPTWDHEPYDNSVALDDINAYIANLQKSVPKPVKDQGLDAFY